MGASSFHSYSNPESSGNQFPNEIAYVNEGFKVVYPPINEDSYDFAPIRELINFVDLSSDDDFKDTFESYFDKESVLRYYLFCLCFASVDTLSKNLHFCRYKDVWYVLPYDLDSVLGGSNVGFLNISSSCEIGDLYDEDDPSIIVEKNQFNSWNSRLWARVRDTFNADLIKMWTTLRSNGTFNYENFMKFFDEITDLIPPTMYNESQQIKYIDYGTTGQIALHGNRKHQIRKFLRERMAYLDSKFGFYSDGGSENYVNIRMNTLGNVNLEIETYYPVYYTVKWATNNIETHRIPRNGKKKFGYFSDVSTDREVLLYLPQSIKKINGLDSLKPASIDISKATKLTEISCKSDKLYSVSLTNNKYLRKIDFNGCKLLGTDTVSTLTLIYAKYLNYVDVRGTQLTAVNFSDKGGSLEKCYLPSTLTSLTVKNQMLLTDLILPYGNNGEDIAQKLATVEISNCPSIKHVSEIEGENMFAVMKYCRSLILNNSFNLETMDFNGFTRLQNITLSNIDALKDIGLNDLCEAGTASNLKYVGVSACLNLKTINMNCSSSDYVITFADDGLLDLSTSNVTTIHSNCIIKGLKTIVVPRTIEEMYFTNDYGSGYSDIKNIWSTSSSVIDSSGVFPSAKHMDAETFITDDYVGIDFYGLKLKNIDLGALVNIPEAINFSLSPTTVNPNFNLHRNGTSIPYLKPHGVLDLSNYVGSLAKFFNGVDLDKMQLKVEKNLPQEDFSYCFFNSTFSDESYIMPLISKITAASNLNYTFYKTTISTYNILDEILLADKGCTMDYTFGECPNITNTDNLELSNKVKSSVGMFYKNPNLTSAEDMKIKVNGSTSKMYQDCKKLNSIVRSTIDNSKDTSYMFSGCSRISTMFDKIPSSCNNANYMYANTSINSCNFNGKEFGSASCTYDGFIEGASGITVYLNTATGKANNFGGIVEGCTNIVVDLTGLDMSHLSDFTSWFEGKSGLKKIILNEVIWGSDLIFDKAFKESNITDDFLLPLTTISCIECFSDISTLKNIHSNWKQTYANGIIPNDCYKNNTAITHVDGENKQSAYSSAMDDIPIIWGGYGFTDENTAIYQFEIPEDNYTLILGRANSASVTINWGDYSSTINEYSHTYTTSGTYTVKTQSLLSKAGSSPHTSVKNSLTKVLQFPTKFYDNDYSLTNIYSGCTKVTDINMSNIDLSNCEHTQTAFENCSSLTTVNIDFTQTVVKSSYAMYGGCTSLTKITREMMPYIIGGDYQCSGCTSLEEVEYVNGDLLRGTFQGCKNLKTIGSLYIGSNHKYNIFGSTNNLANVTFYPYNNQLITQDYASFPTTLLSGKNLTKESILSLFSILGTTTAGLTINLGAKQLARLTEDEKLIAINKGWSLA